MELSRSCFCRADFFHWCHVTRLTVARRTPFLRFSPIRKGWEGWQVCTSQVIWSVGSSLCGWKISALFWKNFIVFRDSFFFPSLIRLLNQVTVLEFGDLLMIFSLSSSSPPALDSCAKKEKRKGGKKSVHLCRVNATVPIILIICISYRLTNKAVSW